VRAHELARELPAEVERNFLRQVKEEQEFLAEYDAVFDLDYYDDVMAPRAYDNYPGVLFLCGVKHSLLKQVETSSLQAERIIGMNLMPTFISRKLKEWCFINDESRKAGLRLAKSLGWEYIEVRDRVGMVTPRILFQIINEACLTLQDGTASVGDIDNAMKLGTNYPYGPLEWADKIGLDHIVNTLRSLAWDDPSRYRPCKLLEEMCYRGETFYPK
jgi:3-hydroxybutyryl-CoA dehydrogenase